MIEATNHGGVTMYRMGREQGGKVLYWVAAFLVDGLLIDTGPSYCAEEFEAELDEDLAAGNVICAVNTHHHEDHIAGNRFLMDRGVRVLAHPDCLDLISARPNLMPYQEIVWGYPEPTRPEPLPTGLLLPNTRFQIIATPGHSRGHVCLFEPDRGWLFTGDLFVSEKLKTVRPQEEIGLMAGEMERLADLPGERLTLFNAVGSIIEDGRSALRNCAGHFRRVIAEAKASAGEGLSPAEIRDKIFGRESVLAAMTSGDFSTENLVRSALRSGRG